MFVNVSSTEYANVMPCHVYVYIRMDGYALAGAIDGSHSAIVETIRYWAVILIDCLCLHNVHHGQFINLFVRVETELHLLNFFCHFFFLLSLQMLFFVIS